MITIMYVYVTLYTVGHLLLLNYTAEICILLLLLFFNFFFIILLLSLLLYIRHLWTGGLSKKDEHHTNTAMVLFTFYLYSLNVCKVP